MSAAPPVPAGAMPATGTGAGTGAGFGMGSGGMGSGAAPRAMPDAVRGAMRADYDWADGNRAEGNRTDGAPAGPARSRAALDAALLDAHAARDGARLVRLYADAARIADAAGDAEAACFYLTHAYVFALETGAPDAAVLHGRLLAAGREE